MKYARPVSIDVYIFSRPIQLDSGPMHVNIRQPICTGQEKTMKKKNKLTNHSLFLMKKSAYLIQLNFTITAIVKQIESLLKFWNENKIKIKIKMSVFTEQINYAKFKSEMSK